MALPNIFTKPVADEVISRINKLGWKASIGLREGVMKTYEWFLKHKDQIRV